MTSEALERLAAIGSLKQEPGDQQEFDGLVRAIRAGATYTNVHSTLFPPGEIRGQNRGHGHD